MNLRDAGTLARSLIAQHCPGYTLRWNNAKTVCGSCNVMRQQITLSRPITLLNEESQVRDTILHEIAHALTPGQDHNWIWRAKARELGARPVRCSGRETQTPAARYHLHCPKCDRVAARFHRKPRKKYLHSHCRTPLITLDTREVRSA